MSHSTAETIGHDRSMADILDRELYNEVEAARLLRLAPSALHWWLEGAERRGRACRPVLRCSTQRRPISGRAPETRRDGADLRASDPTSCNGAAGIVATVGVAAAALSLASSASLWINRVTLDIAG
jgi:hypothetical protein